jgi:hypothetical protein
VIERSSNGTLLIHEKVLPRFPTRPLTFQRVSKVRENFSEESLQYTLSSKGERNIEILKKFRCLVFLIPISELDVIYQLLDDEDPSLSFLSPDEDEALSAIVQLCLD